MTGGMLIPSQHISFYIQSHSMLLLGVPSLPVWLPASIDCRMLYIYGRNWTVFLNLISKTLCLTVSAPSPSFNVGGQDSSPALRALHSLSLVP